MNILKIVATGIISFFFCINNSFAENFAPNEGRRQAEKSYNWKIHLTSEQKCRKEAEEDPKMEGKSDLEKEREIIRRCGAIFPDYRQKSKIVQIKGIPTVVDEGFVASPKPTSCNLLAVRGARLKSSPLVTIPPGTVLATSKKEGTTLFYARGTASCEEWAKDVATIIVADLKSVTNIENGDSYQASSDELPTCLLLSNGTARLVNKPDVVLERGVVIASSKEDNEGQFFERDGKTCTVWRAEVAEKLVIKARLEE